MNAPMFFNNQDPNNSDKQSQARRPRYVHTVNQQDRKSRELIRLLAGLNNAEWIPPQDRHRYHVYQRGGLLVHVKQVRDDRGETHPIIEKFDTGSLARYISVACEVCKASPKKEGGFTYVPYELTERFFKLILNAEFGSEIRDLEAITEAPTLRRDGSIIREPGYDAQSKIIYQPNGEFDVPQNPDQEDAQEAFSRLTDVVREFPFVSECHKSSWVALVLTAVCRNAIDGIVPLFPVIANHAGVGKGKLINLAHIIAYGRNVAEEQIPNSNEELRKKLTALVVEGRPFINLDNAENSGMIRFSALDSFSTAREWSDRILQITKTVRLPVRAVVALSGNRIRFGGDMSRRNQPIELYTDHPNPEQRVFDVDIEEFVRKHRNRLFCDALTIVSGFINAGKPQPEEGQPGYGKHESGFREWFELIRGAILWAGGADPHEAKERAKEDDSTKSAILEIIQGIETTEFADKPWQSSELARLRNSNSASDAFNNALDFHLVDRRTGKVTAESIGLGLRDFRDQYVVVPFDDDQPRLVQEKKCIKKAGGRSDRNKWIIDTMSHVE